MGDLYKLETRAMLIGRCAHQVVQRLLAQDVEPDRVLRAQRLLSETRQVLRENPPGSRERAALIEVASAVATYFRFFTLPAGWAFAGAERSLGRDGRVDVVFANVERGLRLIDEIKVGIGRSHDSALRPQIERYLQAGAAEWGEAFLGVRVCSLGSPRAAQLFVPGRKKGVRLQDTGLWVAC